MTEQDNCQQGRAVRKDRPARCRGIWPELFSPAVAPDRLMPAKGGRTASPGTCPVPNRSTGQHHYGLYHKSLRKTACFGAMAGLGPGGRTLALIADGLGMAGNRILTVGVERKPELAGVGGHGAGRRLGTPTGGEMRLMASAHPDYIRFGAFRRTREARTKTCDSRRRHRESATYAKGDSQDRLAGPRERRCLVPANHYVPSKRLGGGGGGFVILSVPPVGLKILSSSLSKAESKV